MKNKLLSTSKLASSADLNRKKRKHKDEIVKSKVYNEIEPEPKLQKLEIDSEYIPVQKVENEKLYEEEDLPDELLLLNMINQCLIERTNFNNLENNEKVAKIMEYGSSIASKNPELLLQIVLYARRGLNIRSAANFLLAIAAIHPDARKHLSKYYDAVVVTPSDWLEIAQFNRNLNGTISNSLRVAMKTKFAKFDEYQLQKHNKNRKRPKKSKIQPPAIEPIDDYQVLVLDEYSSDEEDERKGPERLSIKNLVRTLHLKDPGYYVMSILGKTYPSTAEEFSKCRLDGSWDASLAGKRMKLKTALTWETELSQKGNVGAAWEGLIMSRKLPYMATLRNLRNIFLAGVSDEAEGKILKYLSNRNAVEKSKQMPFQFYNAHKALEDLEASVDLFLEKNGQKWIEMKHSHAVLTVLKYHWKGKILIPKNAIIGLENYYKVLMAMGVDKKKITDGLIRTKFDIYDYKVQVEALALNREYKIVRQWDELVKEARQIRYDYKRSFDKKWEDSLLC